MNSLAGARLASRTGPRRSSLRTYLVGLILVSTVPVATLLAYEVFHSMRQQQARHDADIDLSGRALAEGVDREVRSAAEVLTALAASASLARDDVTGFAAELATARTGPDAWRGIFLLAPDGRLRFDTSAAEPTRATPPVASIASTPALSPALFPSAAAAPSDAAGIALSPVLQRASDGRPVVALSVPASVGGNSGHRLGAWIDAAAWRRALAASVPSGDALRVVFDQNGQVVATTATIGTAATVASAGVARHAPASGAAALALARQPLGVVRDTSLDDDAVRAVRHAIEPWRWSVAVAVAAAPFASGQRQAFLIAISTGAACMLLGVSLGLLLARRLIQPLDELASNGQAAHARPSAILELERLRERLLGAQRLHDAAMTRLEVKAAEFQALFDGSPIGLAFVQDRDGHSTLHNPAMRALFGAGVGAGRVRVLQDGVLLAESDLPVYRAARSGEPVAAVELQIDPGDGRHPRSVLAEAVPVHDATGEPRGAIGAAIDITRRKLGEQRLADAEARLRENQHLMELAQEAGEVGFFNHDFVDGGSSWSPGQARLFGLEPRTPATFASWWPQVDPEHRPHMRNLLRQVLLLQQPRETFDYRIVRPDGQARWMSSRILMQYLPGGQPRQMIGVTVDVSRHKQLELERGELVQREQAARREAESANRAKDDILAMLGHELRNPLGAISSATEVLQRIDRTSPMATNALEIIGRQTAKLAGILQEWLDAAGVLSGQATLYRAPHDLAPLVRGVVEAARKEAAGAGHELVARLEPVWADVDSGRIEQVVHHLLGNAVKHASPGGRIEVVTEGDGDDAVLRVSDQGAGMSPELLAAIFDPFVQGEQPLDRRRGGLGLGLTLVRRLAALHGGKVTARSSAEGSVFELRLPATAPRTEARGVDPAASLAGDRPRIAARSVVLVEDNADAASALRTSLELDGHTVHAAGDGVAGLAAIVGERPDVAIVDLGLPGLTGFDVALRSRAAGFPGLMIATSGYGQPADTQRTLRSGFDAHLVKPVDAARLRELMATSV